MEYGDLEHSTNRQSLKIDSLSSSNTCAKMFLTTLRTLTMPSNFPPTTFQYHCMDIVEKTTQLLNPGKNCFYESDQLVYKLLKELQLRFRHRFGLKNIFASLDFSYRKINPPSLWFANRRKRLRRNNYDTVWIIHC